MISEFYSDEELLSQLRMFFNEEELEHINFKALLGQLEETDTDTWTLTIKNRLFTIDKTTCYVEEVIT
jgi:hypothetical protein